MRPILLSAFLVIAPTWYAVFTRSPEDADATENCAFDGARETKQHDEPPEPATFDTVRGLVVDTAGNPIPEARVVLRTQYDGVLSSSVEPSSAADIAQTATDATGRFEFRGVRVPTDAVDFRDSEPGLHWLDLVVGAPGFALGWSHAVTPTMPRIVLQPEARLPGRIVDRQQRPVVGAEVRVRYVMSVRQISQLDLGPNMATQNWPGSNDPRFLSLVGAGLRSLSGRTDAGGRFTVGGLPADVGVVLEVDHPDMQLERLYAVTRDRLNPAILTAERDVQVGEIRASLTRGHRIKVRVVFDDTGRPASRARLPLPPFVHPPEGIADEQGQFEYRHIPNGEFPLFVYAPEGAHYLGATQTLELKNGEFEHEMTVRLARGVEITGRVIDRRTMRGVPEVNLIGAPETMPAFKKSPAAVTYGTTTTDNQGTFRMVVAPGKAIIAIRYINPGIGTYRPILPVHADYHDVDPTMRRHVFLDTAKEVKPIVMELTSLSPFRGTVVDQDGKPVPRAEILGVIQLGKAAWRRYRQQAAADGTFELPDLFHGRSARFVPRPAKVLVLDRVRKLGSLIEIEPDAPIDEPLEVRLIPMKTLKGSAFDLTSGKPIVAAKITLAGDTVSPMAVHTDADGTFAITALLRGGHYSIRLAPPGYIPFSEGRSDFVADADDFDLEGIGLRRSPDDDVLLDAGK